MGLDLVEILMETENQFEVSILDSEVYDAVTVGKYVEVVYSKLRKDQNSPCPSQHSFYLIRQNLINTYGLSREKIKLDSKLAEIIPSKKRRHLWEKFKRNLFGQWSTEPEMVFPLWLNRMVVFGIPTSVSSYFLLKFPLEMVWIGIVSSFLIIWFVGWLLTPLKTKFPAEYSTVRKLIPILSATNCRIWTKEEVFEKIKEITAEITGIAPSLITMESHWVNDLGVD